MNYGFHAFSIWFDLIYHSYMYLLILYPELSFLLRYTLDREWYLLCRFSCIVPCSVYHSYQCYCVWAPFCWRLYQLLRIMYYLFKGLYATPPSFSIWTRRKCKSIIGCWCYERSICYIAIHFVFNILFSFSIYILTL